MSMAPFWGFGDPFRWLAYLVAGATMDVGRMTLRGWWGTVWLPVILGGVAHGLKPVLRTWISASNGWLYDSILVGVSYPFWMHVMFGMIGSAAGLALVRARLRLTHRSQ